MTNTIKWTLGIIVLVLVVLGIYQASTSEAPLSGGAMKVGVAVAKSGAGAEWGADELRAIEIAFDAANDGGGVSGRPVDLVVEDTKSDNVGTANAFNKLIKVDKVPLIIGPTWGDAFQSGYPIAKQAGVVIVGPSVAVEVLDRSLLGDFFATWWPQIPEVNTVIDWMLTTKHERVVMIYDQDVFNTKFSEIFAEEAKKKGVTILEKFVLPIGDNDFRTTLAKAKALQPSSFFVELQDVGSFGPFMKQARELGINATVVSTATTQNQQLLADYKAVVEGLTYSYPLVNEDASYQLLVETYEKRYGEKPSGPSFVNAYNAALATIAAFRDAASTGVSLTQALQRVDIPGVGIERVSFGATGQVEQAAFRMKTVRNGQFVNLE